MAPEREPFKCSPDSCAYHLVMTEIVTSLKSAVGDIMEAQGEMRQSVTQLTEAFKGVERLERRIDKLEERQLKKEEAQDIRIDVQSKQIEKNTNTIYMWMGGLTLAGILLAPIVNVGLGLLVNYWK